MNSVKSQLLSQSGPPIPKNESLRMNALEGYRILDTLDEVEFNDIVELASRICEAPISLISLVDHQRQWFKAKVGLEATETSRDVAFCAYAINGSSTFIVEDTLLDARFSNNPLVVNEPFIRFYAGAPLRTQDGFNLGTLCIIDHKSRLLTQKQKEALEILARQVVSNLERRKLKFEVFEQKHFLDKVLSSIPVHVFYGDSKYDCKYINAATEKFLNCNAENTIGRPLSEVFGASLFSKVKPFFDLALKDISDEFEFQIEQTSGENIIFQGRYIPDRNGDGKINGIFGVAIDITELKRIQNLAVEQGVQLESLLQWALFSERSIRTLFDSAPMGIVQLQSNLNFLSTNSAFREFLGYNQDELETMSIFDVIHPDDLESMKQLANDANSPDFVIKRLEKRFIQKSGKNVWALINCRSVQLIKNTKPTLFSIIEDITEGKETEEVLKKTQLMLVNSAKMASLGEMASGVAHEINNPLAIISGKATVLRNRLANNNLEPKKLEADLITIEKTVVRISKIVKSLNLFSRNSRDDFSEQAQIVNLVKDTFEICRDRFKDLECEFRFNYSEDGSIACRPSEISQVLLNLMNNACDAVQNLKEKWVSIQIERFENKLLVKVCDSGNGIPQEVVDKIMEPFFTTKEVGHGTGLGLSISKGIAEAHGGSLVYNLEHGNTCFLLTLPELVLNLKRAKPLAS